MIAIQRTLQRYRSRKRRGDQGFSLVELMVASGVVLFAMVLIASIQTSGLSVIGLSRQRQSGTGLVNQTMEKVRALPFDTLARGLSDADLAATAGTTDPDINSSCGAAYCYKGERLVSGNNVTTDPLVPHMRTSTVGPTEYTVKAYVTYYLNDLTSRTFRVTVVVTWEKPAVRSASGRQEAQTIINTPTGCLSTSVHPFSGPCQASFSANGLVQTGSVNITGALQSVAFDHATLWLPRESSDMLVEQISTVQGISQQSGISIQQTGQAEQTAGRGQASSGADNDPAQPASAYSTADTSAQSPTTQTVASGTDSVSVTMTSGDTGRTTSTTSASTASAPQRLCPNLSGFTNDNDELPCGGSSARQQATLTATANLHTGGVNLGSLQLASVGTQSAAATSTTDRNITPAGAVCVATTGAGCARARVSRAPQDISIAGLPSGISAGSLPPGWLGYTVRISGLADQATAESGIGVSAPSATVSAGTITYYVLGVGYVNVSVSSMPSSIPLPPLIVNDPANGVTLTISGTINGGSRTTSDPARDADPVGCAVTCTRTSATATSTPPTVTLNYQISASGQTESFSITLNPGDLQAKATYAPAPTP